MADKPLIWLEGEIQTPPFSEAARIEAGYLIRRLQMGEKLSMPHSEPMTTIGPRCHSLRIKDAAAEWRIIYRLDDDAIVVLEVFSKKTKKTPDHLIETCKKRLKDYDGS